MIVNKIIVVCPVCDESVEIRVGDPDFRIEFCNNDILITFRCDKCNERIDREAWEQE